MRDPARKAEKIMYVCALILAMMVICLSFLHTPAKGNESYFVFYADFIFDASESWEGFIFVLLFVVGLSLSVAGWIKNVAGQQKRSLKELVQDFRHSTNGWAKGIFDLLRLAFPIFLNLFLFSYVVGYVNAINRSRLIGPDLAAVDRWLTGTYLFLRLEMVWFPSWLIEAVEFSFLNLTFFLVLIAVITYSRNRLAFSKYAVAFFTSILLMIPLWLAVPVMSPQDRFIDNVYHLEDPPQMTAALEKYKPVPQVESFLRQMRQAKSGLDIMPTTTFPSSHAAWATIAFIYLLEASSAASIIFGPFLLLSTIGTFYLAQHYFVDTPAGIIIGLISVLIVSYAFRERDDNSNRLWRR